LIRAEGTRDQNLTHKPNQVAEHKSNHHRPGGARDLAIGV